MASNDDLIDHEKDVLIDDLKEELHYIKKKIKQYKYSEETFENEMDLVECENKNLRKDLEKVKKELSEAKDHIKEFESLENMEIEELEMKQNIANGIIQKLKTDVMEVENLRKENNKLEIEVRNLKTEKEVSDEIVMTEKKGLEDRIVKAEFIEKDRDKLSEENEIIKEELEMMRIITFNAKSETQEVAKSLFEEINSISKIQSCEICKKTFNDQHRLELHKEKCHKRIDLEHYASQLQVGIFNQRLNLNKEIFEVKETEINAKYSCNSSCGASCRIFHQKHDWSKSVSERLLNQFNSINVETLPNLKEHIERKHSEDEEPLEKNTKFDKLAETAPAEVIISSSQNLLSQSDLDAYTEENFVDNFHHSEESPKNVCNVCLLSFNIEDELRKHMPKHLKAARPPPILKNLLSLSVVS